MIERDKTQITTLSSNKVITEIEGQTDPDHGNQVLTNDIALFNESLHPPNESRLIPRVKQNRERNQTVMWKHL